ncbi:MAG: hypothetical protein PHV28_06070 [Kiritimatiellae bacterium]|nr:hypothetical protein [Kiritimatiellia bacterium]
MSNRNNSLKPSVSRRKVLKLGAAGTIVFSLPSFAAGKGEAKTGEGTARHAKLTGLLHNEDCTNFFYYQDFPDGKAGEIVDRYVDVLVGAGVSVLMCNVNARRTNYRSKVWESFWDGYDPAGPDEQPFLAPVKVRIKSYRKLVGNMFEVHRQGVDYPARVIQRCRARNISPWLSVRMNDVHENDNLDHPFHSALWRRPELFRQGHPGYYARALDFAHAEVRNHYQALIGELLERYDLDGLELDFLREPYLFSAGKEQEGRQILTGWLRGIRTLADAAAKRLGHAVKLGVRVPSTPGTAIGLGLDAPAWVNEGLIDLVVAAPRWATLEYDMPLGEWRKLVGDRVTLAGGLEVLYRPYPAATGRFVTREEAVGAAVAVLSGGADSVYLFNYFQHGQPGWPIPEYQRILNACSSLDKLLKLPRRHAVTHRDVTVPGESYRAPLPATGAALSFALPLGPVPPPDWQVGLDIEIKVGGEVLPVASLNGVVGVSKNRETGKNGTCVASYRFPCAALSGTKTDQLTVTMPDKTSFTVHRVEVAVYPG